jgi:quinolinate synthase
MNQMNRLAYDTLSPGELAGRIQAAKTAKNAVILAHNYQVMEVQDIADHIGDSLELARIAARTEAELVVFCGVDFMAESAKILAPDKTVLLPEYSATCPMANMVTPEALRKAREEHPDVEVVAYVNTTAATKALVDICCTSANAMSVVRSLDPARGKLFVPDRNLGDYINRQTGAGMRLWDGYCVVHDRMNVAQVERARREHPGAVFLVHPEAPPDVVALADRVLSTSGMVRHVQEITDSDEKRRGVIIGTEVGLVDQLRRHHPDVNIWPLLETAICRNMKKTTLQQVCWAIETGNYKVEVSADISAKARASLEKMIAIG